MKIKSLIVILLLITSCQALKDNRANNKMNWLIKNHYLGDTTRWVHDTITGFKIDTVFKGDTIKDVDTFTIVKDGIKTVSVVKWKERILEQTLVKRDTIISKIVTEKVVYQTAKKKWWDRYWAGFAFGVALMILLIFFISRIAKS
jgi:hypothetical protein